MDMESPDIYAAVRSRAVQLARELSDDDAATEVPACPGWTVKDVIAHVTGIAADVVGGNLGDAGTDAWTAAQVESRSDRSLHEVLDEWESLAQPLEGVLTTLGPLVVRGARDVLVHEHDIRAASGRPGGRSGELMDALTATYAADYVARVDAAELAPVGVDVGGRRVGAVDAEVTVGGTTFELLRSLTGRRSRAQVEALEWQGRTDQHVALFTTYGAFPIVDVDEG